MTKQIRVRLADDLVDFIDRKVKSGQAPSRAAVVADAVEGARRREIAERDVAEREIAEREIAEPDVAILAKADPESDDFAAFAAHIPLDDLG
jgi:Arc/MetJ-type ribon-helix-helix transcriptional regulator